MRRIWIGLGILVILIGLGLAGYLGFHSNGPQSTNAAQAPLTATVSRCDISQSVTAPGSAVNFGEAVIQMPFEGKLTQVFVQPGDSVKAGQVLAQFDSRPQQLALDSAKQALAELTSPEAIANAELAVTNAQTDVINAQTALNNTQYWQNEALVKNYYASYVIAKANLEKAQNAYDNAHVGQYINNAAQAGAYQALYNAQQVYNTAFYYYSLYSQKPTQRQVTEAQATLDLANARLQSAQNYLTAVSGGVIPADATGSALETLLNAQQALQTTQDNLEATNLTAPFSGVILKSEAVAGVTIPGGSELFTVHDPKNIEIETTVTQQDFVRVQLGQKTSLYFDALPDVVGNGTVSRIVPELVPGDSPLYYVYVRMQQVPAGLVNGMTADAYISIASRKAVLCLPRSVVHASASNQVELQVWNGTASVNRQVTIGLRGDSNDEILSGLAEGEQVLVK